MLEWLSKDVPQVLQPPDTSINAMWPPLTRLQSQNNTNAVVADVDTGIDCIFDILTAPFTTPPLSSSALQPTSISGPLLSGEPSRYLPTLTAEDVSPESMSAIDTAGPPLETEMALGDEIVTESDASDSVYSADQSSDVEDNTQPLKREAQSMPKDSVPVPGHSARRHKCREFNAVTKQGPSLLKVTAKEVRALRRREFHKIHTRRSRAKLNEKMDMLRDVLPEPPAGVHLKSKAQILDYAISIFRETRNGCNTADGDHKTPCFRSAASKLI